VEDVAQRIKGMQKKPSMSEERMKLPTWSVGEIDACSKKSE
jgi:hypothetical protein